MVPKMLNFLQLYRIGVICAFMTLHSKEVAAENSIFDTLDLHISETVDERREILSNSVFSHPCYAGKVKKFNSFYKQPEAKFSR